MVAGRITPFGTCDHFERMSNPLGELPPEHRIVRLQRGIARLTQPR
jgi:hypothetical protein